MPPGRHRTAVPRRAVPLLTAQALVMGLPMPKQYFPGALPPFEPDTRLSTPAVPLSGSSSALPTPSLQGAKQVAILIFHRTHLSRSYALQCTTICRKLSVVKLQCRYRAALVHRQRRRSRHVPATGGQ